MDSDCTQKGLLYFKFTNTPTRCLIACSLISSDTLQSGEFCLTGTCTADSEAPFKDTSGTVKCVARCPSFYTESDNLTCAQKCDDYFVDKFGNYICAPTDCKPN